MPPRRATSAIPPAATSLLQQPLESLKGVGPARAAAFASAGLHTVRDLLMLLPRRFVALPHATSIVKLELGRDAAVVARVTTIVPSRRRLGATRIDVEDSTGTVALVFFNQPHVGSSFVRGAWVYALGRVGERSGKRFLGVATYEFVADAGVSRPAAAQPVYELPDEIPPRLHRRLVRALAATAAAQLDDWRAGLTIDTDDLLSLPAAIAAAHAAEDEVALSSARRRFAYDEFVRHLKPMVVQRAQVDRARKPAVVVLEDAKRHALCAALPFVLTRAQQRVLSEIVADLARPTPMHRLLHGDVGSGKTAIALLAAAAVVHAGHQTALLAPTGLLAEQHARTAAQLAQPLGIAFGILTAATPAPVRAALLARLAAREPMLLIGTHALLSERVRLPALRLAIVDEQHRFGVQQRAKLRAKAPHVDLLVMSATPIPRTLALAVFGDLDVSALDELPPGRTPVATEVRERRELAAVVHTIRDVALAGGRVFVVCPLVEDSAERDLVAAVTLAKKLAAAFRERPAVGLAHGRRSFADNERALAAFKSGAVPVLVSTMVVEVGVDVPEATLMVVVDAERFGLAALHQLRGRVGRSERASRCILVAREATPESRARLDVLVEHHDGLLIAERDLALRGPGELAGSRQHGALDFRYADLARDLDLLAKAQRDLRAWVEAGRISAAEVGRDGGRVVGPG